MGKTYILLPAKNEAASVESVIKEIRQYTKEQIVLVDGNSQDNTIVIAAQMGAKIIQQTSPNGKGQAIRQAFSILLPDADYVIMLDCDTTYPPKHIPEMLENLKEYDIVSGARLSKESSRDKGAMSAPHLFGNRMLTLVANLLFDTPTQDLCTGYWGFSKKAMSKMCLTADSFDIEANIFTEINKHKLSYCEIPIQYRARRNSKSKLHPAHFIIILKRLIKERIAK